MVTYLKWTAIVVLAGIAGLILFVILFERFWWYIGIRIRVEEVYEQVMEAISAGYDGYQVRFTDRESGTVATVTKSMRGDSPTEFYLQVELTRPQTDLRDGLQRMAEDAKCKASYLEEEKGARAVFVWQEWSPEPAMLAVSLFTHLLQRSSDHRVGFRCRGGSDLLGNKRVGWDNNDDQDSIADDVTR